jgi:hypothetical protein
LLYCRLLVVPLSFSRENPLNRSQTQQSRKNRKNRRCQHSPIVLEHNFGIGSRSIGHNGSFFSVPHAKTHRIRYALVMAGIRGKSGPPGNQNAFRHGLAGISQRRVNGALTQAEQSIREEILNGLINDKGGEAQISTAVRVLAEVIASDAAGLVAVNTAVEVPLLSSVKAFSSAS